MTETPNLDALIDGRTWLASGAKAEASSLKAENALLAKKAAMAEEYAAWCLEPYSTDKPGFDITGWLTRWSSLSESIPAAGSEEGRDVE